MADEWGIEIRDARRPDEVVGVTVTRTTPMPEYDGPDLFRLVVDKVWLLGLSEGDVWVTTPDV